MFENLLYQDVKNLLSEDIIHDSFPGAVLLAGPPASGKLTAALELARVLSCTGTKQSDRGQWMCDCPSCRMNKELAGINVLLAGPRDCAPEIRAAQAVLVRAVPEESSPVVAARYLFIRAVRKLTLRFSQVLWEDDEKVSKIASCTQAIDEQLERISMSEPLPELPLLVKILDEIVAQAEKLEKGFMYESLPVSQVRRIAAWSHLKSSGGKKVVIIENAERMLESVRNALLKILEEPPADTIFILTTTRRGAVLPTILSRVRTYTFVQRTAEQEAEVIERVFHDSVAAGVSAGNTILDAYLLRFLPVPPEKIAEAAARFYGEMKQGAIPSVESVVKSCAGFEPRILFKIFLASILEAQRCVPFSPAYVECAAQSVVVVTECYNNVYSYNQSPAAALEKLIRDFAVLRRKYGGI
jgi:DNA polymerase III subunit gamma/tau